MALDFETGDAADRVSFGTHAAAFPGTNDFSVAALIKLTSIVDSAAALWTGAYSNSQRGWQLRSVATSSLQIVVGNATDRKAVNSSALSTGVWYHVVATVDRSGDLTLYIDGSSDGTPVDISSHSGSYSGAYDFYEGAAFGAAPPGTPKWFDGVVGDVAIWSKALSAAEVGMLYGAGVGYASPASVAPGSLGFYTRNAIALPVDLVTGLVAGNAGPPTVAEGPYVSGPGLYGGLQNVGGFSARRRNIIDLLTGDQTGAGYWDENKASIPNSAVTRTSETQVTIDLDALDGVIDVSTTETVSLGDLTADMWKP